MPAPMEKKITTRFRELLKRPELLVMSGGFSPLHARMSEVLGYEAFFMSGSQVAAYVYGYPDVGLLGLSEMVEAVRRITNVTGIPVFADADTGYGNAVNVHYTVQAYIRAGAAGLHIEDQESPKKSGTLAGRRLISVEEAVGKYKAAMAAKRELDADFVVCARCDSIGSEGGGFDDAVKRGIAYVNGSRRRRGVDEYDDQARRDRRSLPAHRRAGHCSLLWSTPVAGLRRVSKTRCRGGFVSEFNHRQRIAIDLGAAARIQSARSRGPRRVE